MESLGILSFLDPVMHVRVYVYTTYHLLCIQCPEPLPRPELKYSKQYSEI